VARRHDVSTALIYTWRRKLCQPVAEPGFAEAVVIAGDGAEPAITPPAIIVELARGSRVSIFASAPPALAAAALKALR
jgi:transposase